MESEEVFFLSGRCCVEVDGLESEEGSLGSKDNTCTPHDPCSERGSAHLGVWECVGRRLERVGEDGRGGHQGPWGWSGQSFQRRPHVRMACACLRHSGITPGSRTGVSQPGEGRGGRCATFLLDGGRTQHFGSRLGAFKPLLVQVVSLSSEQCLCFNIWLCGVFTASSL